jgi:hypothetical protein
MARKTKAELTAEREAAEAARLLAMAEAYPARLMALLERATKENFELTVKNGEFRVEDLDNRRANAYLLTLEFSKFADSTLDELEWDVQSKEEARAESERLSALRRQAFLKLSEEEQNALGLTDRNNW